MSNLEEFLKLRRATEVTASPDVPGCGIIDRAAADLLIRRPQSRDPMAALLAVTDPNVASRDEFLLYEVKAVARPFRATDFRQLITYAALMAAAGQAPEFVGLVNPRLGTYFESSVDELIMEVSGVSADELLQQIVFDVSGADVSLWPAGPQREWGPGSGLLRLRLTQS